MTEHVRHLVRERAKGRCEYCLSPVDFSPDPFTVEHIIPKSKGGSDIEANLAFACQGCNGRKYNHIKARDPLSDNFVLLYHPRDHNWHDHFTWDDSNTQFIAVSPTGRASIERLKLNRREVVNLRKLLILIGEHP